MCQTARKGFVAFLFRVSLVLKNAQEEGFFYTLGLQNHPTVFVFINLYKRPVLRGFTVIYHNEVTHKQIRVGQCFHVVYQEIMNCDKIIV